MHKLGPLVGAGPHCATMHKLGTVGTGRVSGYATMHKLGPLVGAGPLVVQPHIS